MSSMSTGSGQLGRDRAWVCVDVVNAAPFLATAPVERVYEVTGQSLDSSSEEHPGHF